MKSWPTKKLGEVIDVNFGDRITRTNNSGNKYPVYGGGGESFRTDKFNRENEFVISRFAIAENCVRFVENKFWLMDSGGTFSIKKDFVDKLDKNFTGNVLLMRQKEIYNCARGGAQKNIDVNFFKKIEIPLPPLAIQKQIVERLDKIAEAQKLNDDLIQKTNELFQSLLYSLIRANSGITKKLGDKNIVEIIDGDRGKNYPPKNEFQKTGYCLFLNTKNVTQTGFIFNETDFISKERDEKLRKGKLQRNDVVLTTRGTVGNSALYDDSVEFNHIRINSGMVVLRSNIKEILPKFLWIILGSKPTLRQFKQILSGTAQPQLPITNLVKIKFPLPPLKTQKQIVAKLSAVQDYKKQLLEQKSKLKELFDSALSKSFKS